MALNPNFKQELLEKYKKSVLILAESEKYTEILNKYNDLKKSIDGKLQTINGAFCKYAEKYINEENYEIIPLGGFDINSNLELKRDFEKLIKLYKDLQSFGWKDNLVRCLDVILVVGASSDLEKEIKKEFGENQGQDIINEVKFQVVDFEKLNNVEIYTKDVKKIIALNKLKELYSFSSVITITEKDNVIEEDIILKNLDGEYFNFRKTGQIKYKGVNYFELELLSELEDSREYNFYIYRIEEISNGQKFIIEEGQDVFYEVSDLLEIFKIQTEIKKNKQAKE